MIGAKILFSVLLLLTLTIELIEIAKLVAENCVEQARCIILGTMFGTILTFSIGIIFTDFSKGPKPIDVYRGQTELVITNTITENNDTIKSDSTVVWKK